MHSHEEWLLKAHSDLRAAKKLMRGNDLMPDAAIYHTQQCAEKALKAYFAFKAQPILKTHNLEYLTKLCGALDQSFLSLLADAEILNPYCFKFRYPDDIIFPEKEDVVEAIELAQKILNFVRKKIKAPQNPTKSIFE